MDPVKKFNDKVTKNIECLGDNNHLRDLSYKWLSDASKVGNYSYNFSWLSRPIIQYPQDIVCLQELIWKIKPDLIIETGIAHGGSLILNASLLTLIDFCEAHENNTVLNTKRSKRKVLGIDIDIRKHNKDAIQKHPMSSKFK